MKKIGTFINKVLDYLFMFLFISIEFFILMSISKEIIMSFFPYIELGREITENFSFNTLIGLFFGLSSLLISISIVLFIKFFDPKDMLIKNILKKILK